MKRACLVLLALLVVAGLAFATGKQDTAPVTVKFLRHSGYDADPMKAFVEPFKAKTGINVQVDLVAYSEIHNKMVVELASGVGTYDLMALTDYWVAEFGAAGWLKPLDPYLADKKLNDPNFDLADISQSLRDGNSAGGKLLALPWKFNIPVLFYRTDLVKSPPKTWDEMLATAKAVATKDVYGVGYSLSKASFPTIFEDALYSNGGRLFTPDLKKVAFNSPEGVEALQYILALNALAAPGAISRHWDESGALMAQGKSAMDIFVPGQLATVSDPNKSQVVGKIGFAPIPGKKKSSANITTWALAITGNSQHPKEAFQYIQYVLSKEKLKEMTLTLKGGIIPSRSSLLKDPAVATYPLLVAAGQAVADAYAKTNIPALTAIEDIIAAYGQKAVNGELSPKDALDQAAAEANAKLAK
jgi:multiple sugar transport system substrate-binding protein